MKGIRKLPGILGEERMLNERLIRAMCVDLAKRLPLREIRPDGVPYLDRYCVHGWTPQSRAHFGTSVYLHHFRGSDPQDTVHSHPWHAVSLVLAGGYREFRCEAGVETVRDLRPGDVNVLAPTDRHRIELLTPDCWTLFLVSAFEQPWQFYPTC